MDASRWLIIIAVLAGAWLAAALWATWRGRRLAVAAAAVLEENARLAALVAAGPTLPLLIGRDGVLTGQERVAAALGLEAVPDRWSDLLERAFPGHEQAAELDRGVREASTG